MLYIQGADPSKGEDSSKASGTKLRLDCEKHELLGSASRRREWQQVTAN
jgi:hypothetical protein